MNWTALYILVALAVLIGIGMVVFFLMTTGALAGVLGWAVRKVAPSLLPLSWKQAKENKFWTAVVALCGVILWILIASLLWAPWPKLSRLLSLSGLCSTLLTFVLWAIYGIASIRADSRPAPPAARRETEFAENYRNAGLQHQLALPSKPTGITGADDIDRACSILGVLGVVLSTPYVMFCALAPARGIHLFSFLDEPQFLFNALMLAMSWVLLMLRASIRRAAESRAEAWRTTRDIVVSVVLVSATARAVSTASASGAPWTQTVAAAVAVFGAAFTVVLGGFMRFVRTSWRGPRAERGANER